MATSVGEPVHMSEPSTSFFSSAPLLRTPQRATFSQLAAASFGKSAEPFSRWTVERPVLAIAAAPLGQTTKSCTVISPLVSVPVLSEQNTETQPNVSTASIFRTSTFRLAISLDAIINEIVTVGRRPSGTCEKSAHAVYWIVSAGVAFWMTLTAKLTSATPMAITAMKCTKCSIWISKVDFTREVMMLCAIFPKKVPSPVACTTQVALPFSTVVPKNAKLRASVHGTVGFSALACLGSGNDSPVSAELSTSMPSVQ
mmetsp:Transcript_1739/g.4958  ORF Transcript_1739/g.4958 Transcript_1739/m.4958 type:complete len:256 (+) Transcript_1739:924-1691(+)